MKIAFFDTHAFEQEYYTKLNQKFHFEIDFFSFKLSESTAVLAANFDAVCIFVNDKADAKTIEILAKNGVRLLALRSAGFNHVDLKATRDFGLKVVRVPEYSPYAVAEHAMTLLMSINRKIHRAYQRVRDGNFSLDGLVGFDLHGKTVGVVGTGKIGRVMIKILQGFQCKVLAYDLNEHPEVIAAGVSYVPFEEILKKSDVISLHVPLTKTTKHLMNEKTFSLMKKGAIIINTGRGALIDTKALIEKLKSGHLGGAGLDVYEEEEGLFFSDHSGEVLLDDQLVRLLTFPNVIMTSHQAFLTKEALEAIAATTLQNVSDFSKQKVLSNEVKI